MGLFSKLDQKFKDLQQQAQQAAQAHQTQQAGFRPPSPSGGSRAPVLASTFLTNQDPSNGRPALQPVQNPFRGAIPPGQLCYTLQHPDPQYDEPTRFFLTCIPDPIGLAYHALNFARLKLVDPQYPTNWAWKHITIEITDEKGPGLAWTASGKCTICISWIRNLMKDYQEGKKTLEACAFEFKGVIMHELVHVIQHDGRGSSPSWLTESVADYIRMQTDLGPPHWRKPGQGKRDEGWKDGYDAGANFLAWLTGETKDDLVHIAQETSMQPTPTATGPPGAQQSQYPPNEKYPPRVPVRPGKQRRGPFPNLVRHMDYRLANERYSENWWQEMAGAPLPQLWREYLDYYT